MNTEAEHKNTLVHRFVSRLYELAQREDRGALAALRRSLQDPSGMAPAACPYVVPFLPPQPDLYRERAFFLVAALFALAGTHGSGVSVGTAFRRIQGEAADDSTRLRFVALLDADPDDVGEHLRHAASLARAKDIALDWERLLNDLLWLRNPDRPVQRRWARDFWGRAHDDSDTETSSPKVTP